MRELRANDKTNLHLLIYSAQAFVVGNWTERQTDNIKLKTEK
jgi:hypothetical protein